MKKYLLTIILSIPIIACAQSPLRLRAIRVDSLWSNTPVNQIVINDSLKVTGILTVDKNIYLPTTTSTAGGIYVNGERAFHLFGSSNLFAGGAAGNFTLSGGVENVSIGSGSGSTLSSGDDNTFLGFVAGGGLSSGSQNTFLGAGAGRNNNGTRNVFIGYLSGYNSTESNKLYIETSISATPLIGGDFSADSVDINGTLNVTEDVNIAGGDVFSSATTFNLFPATVTTGNLFSAGTTIGIGAITGTLTLNNPTVVGQGTTATLWNTANTTVNAFGAATTLNLAATTGTTTINNDLTVGDELAVSGTGTSTFAGAITSSAGIKSTQYTTTPPFSSQSTSAATEWRWGIYSTDSTWRLEKVGVTYAFIIAPATGRIAIPNDLAFEGTSTPDITTTATGTGTVFNANATTLKLGEAATTVSLGAATGTATINNASLVTKAITSTGLSLLDSVKTTTIKPISTGGAPIVGNATLVAGTVTVSTTAAKGNSIVMLTRKTSGGTIGTAITYTISASTSFTITSDSILDTSTFSWFILVPY